MSINSNKNRSLKQTLLFDAHFFYFLLIVYQSLASNLLRNFYLFHFECELRLESWWFWLLLILFARKITITYFVKFYIFVYHVRSNKVNEKCENHSIFRAYRTSCVQNFWSKFVLFMGSIWIWILFFVICKIKDGFFVLLFARRRRNHTMVEGRSKTHHKII